MKIGPHVNDNGQTDALIAYCARVKPPVIKMLAPAADIIARVKAVSPGTRVVGRVVWDPQTLDAYGDFQKRTLSRAREVGHGVDWWEGFNEHITDDAPATYIRKFADAEVGLAKRLLDAGFGAAIGGFSTGVLDDREIDPFMQALQFCHDNSGRVLFHFHEYSGPYMQFGVKTADGKNQQPHGSGFTGATTDPRLLESPALRGWLTLRYRDLWEIIQRRGLTGVRMLISESGIDNVTNRPGGQGRGWRDFHNTEWSRLPGIGDFAEQMAWYARQLSHDHYIVGAVDFGWGAVSRDWHSFDLTRDRDMLERFTALQASIGAAPVPPAPGGGTVPDLVALLRAEFGASFDDLRAALPTRPDGPNGPFRTRDLAIVKSLAWHHTAGAKTATWEEVARGHLARDFAGIGYHFGIQQGRVAYLGDVTTSRANVEAQNPWVIGICVAGDYTRDALDAQDLALAKRLVAVLDRFLGRQLPCEPHAKWVATACPGDALKAVLGSLRTATAPTPPSASLAGTLLAAGAAAQRLRLNKAAAIQKAIAAAGFVPTSDEFEVVFGGTRYVAQLAEHLTTGAVRVVYCKVGDWGHVESVQRP